MAAKKIVKKTATPPTEQKVVNNTAPVNKFQKLGKNKTLGGSILNPETGGLRFVLSVNNLKGDPNGNPLLSLFDKRWRKVREESRGWYVNKNGSYKLGVLKDIAVQSDVWVVGMLCQGEDLKVDLEGLSACFKNLRKMAKDEQATVHVSSLLTDLIPELTNLAQTELVNHGVSVYFYTGDQE